MKFIIETKTDLRYASDEECHMIEWHSEVGEELRLYGITNVYQEDLTELSDITKNSRWSRYCSFPKGWAEPGKERMIPCFLYDKYMEATPERQKLFMDWIHREYDIPEELAYHMTGMQEALYVLDVKR